MLCYVHRNRRNFCDHCLKIWNLGFVHFGSTDPLRHGERNGRSWISETQLPSCLAQLHMVSGENIFSAWLLKQCIWFWFWYWVGVGFVFYYQHFCLHQRDPPLETYLIGWLTSMKGRRRPRLEQELLSSIVWYRFKVKCGIVSFEKTSRGWYWGRVPQWSWDDNATLAPQVLSLFVTLYNLQFK